MIFNLLFTVRTYVRICMRSYACRYVALCGMPVHMHECMHAVCMHINYVTAWLYENPPLTHI